MGCTTAHADIMAVYIMTEVYQTLGAWQRPTSIALTLQCTLGMQTQLQAAKEVS